jgi:hypothetical protein
MRGSGKLYGKCVGGITRFVRANLSVFTLA